MEPESSIVRFLYICGAALAGAISALPSMRWREMALPERFMTVFVGSTFAVFLTPLVVAKIGFTDTQMICALTYLMGLVGNAIVPVVIERGRKIAREWGEKRTEKAP